MTVALYILIALLAVGAALWMLDRRHRDAPDTQAPSDANEDAKADDACCGMHITCERDSLLASVSDKIEYFEDEELDAYKDRDASAYSEAEIEQFRDVLLTLRPDDIAPWARSLQLRGIQLPPLVRDELMLIVTEARRERASRNTKDVPTA